MVGRASESEHPLFIPYHHHPPPPFRATYSVLVPRLFAPPSSYLIPVHYSLALLGAMSAAKKTSDTKSAGTKKAAPRAAPTHPSWIDMIKVGACDALGPTTSMPFALTALVAAGRAASATSPKRGRVQGMPAAPRHLSPSCPAPSAFCRASLHTCRAALRCAPGRVNRWANCDSEQKF